MRRPMQLFTSAIIFVAAKEGPKSLSVDQKTNGGWNCSTSGERGKMKILFPPTSYRSGGLASKLGLAINSLATFIGCSNSCSATLFDPLSEIKSANLGGFLPPAAAAS